MWEEADPARRPCLAEPAKAPRDAIRYLNSGQPAGSFFSNSTATPHSEVNMPRLSWPMGAALVLAGQPVL